MNLHELEFSSPSIINFDIKEIEQWYVLYTQPRQELKIYEKLSYMGVEAYCPYVIQIRQWSDRKKKIKVPVIPSTIFVKLADHQRRLVFNCSGVKRYMFFNKKIVTVPQYEIDILKQSLEGKQCLNHSISKLKVGDQVKLDQFDNTLAKVKKISSNRIWVQLHSLNLNISIDL